MEALEGECLKGNHIQGSQRQVGRKVYYEAILCEQRPTSLVEAQSECRAMFCKDGILLTLFLIALVRLDWRPI